MDIMEMATELGKLIKSSDIFREYAEADKAYDADEVLANLINEYNAQREAIELEEKKSEPDAVLVSTIEKRVEKLYSDIVENDTFLRYSAAQKALNKLMTDVNGEITFQVTGRRPCSGEDCASCGGCN